MAGAPAQEKMMQVIDALERNPSIVIIGGFEATGLQANREPITPNGWHHTLEIYGHPRTPLYTADQLNDFMQEAVRGVEPSQQDLFVELPDGDLELGKLYFDEVIGNVSLAAAVTLNPQNSLVRDGRLPESWSTRRAFDLGQRTWLRIFPDAGHACNAAEGDNQYRIPQSMLRNSNAPWVVEGLRETRLLDHLVDRK